MKTHPSRRVPLAVVALGAALLLLCTACDWTQYMGNAALTGNALDETTISASNVAQLTQTFTIPLPGGSNVEMFTPVVSQNVLYVGTTNGKLVAASANGTTGCSGSPVVCQPLWTASLPGLVGAFTPVVAGGVVYDTFVNAGLTSGELAAFDATGTTNCSGAPKTCQPLWTAPVVAASPPNLDHGTLFVDDVAAGQLRAFDAAGATNCTGAPKVCQPLWTASGLSYDTPSVAGGRVYVSTMTNSSLVVSAFDEAGTINCAGGPKVCQPEFSVGLPGSLKAGNPGAVDVTDGTGYLDLVPFTGPALLVAFDATGATDCSGSPVVCQPLWTGTLPGQVDFVPPAVANSMVYAPTADGATAFDATGTTGCSGTPKVCQPRFDAATSTGSNNPDDATMVAGGLLLTGNDVFDAGGTTNCSVAAPVRTCTPLWTSPSPTAFAAMIIANGTLYAVSGRSGGGSIDAYRVPGT